MKVTFCTTCMGRAHHLKQTLPRNLADSVDWSAPEQTEFVILDYSSPDDLGEWLHTDPEIAPYLEAGIVRYFRVDGEQYFRHSHAKNLAHAHATGDVVCNVDADNFLGKGFAVWLRRAFERRPNAIVATNRFDNRLNSGAFKGAMGRVAMMSHNFWRLGGYDESERFKGWSGEDTDLVLRAAKSGMRMVLLRDKRFLQIIVHSDSERITMTDYTDEGAELARVRSLDGSRVFPNVRYFIHSARAPRVANRLDQPTTRRFASVRRLRPSRLRARLGGRFSSRLSSGLGSRLRRYR